MALGKGCSQNLLRDSIPMKNFKQARNQGGFSLVELLLVLAIIAALAVAAFIVYPRVQAGRNATYESQVLSSAQAGVKALFTTNNYANLTTTAAYNAEIFPRNMNVEGGTTIENQWGGLVVASGSTAAGADSATSPTRYFKFVYPNVPTDVCIRLAGAAVQNFGAVLIGEDAAGATAVVNTYDTDEDNNIVDEAAIALQCKQDSGNATIVFVSN